MTPPAVSATPRCASSLSAPDTVMSGIVVVGASAGGLPVITELAKALGDCPWPVAVVQHLGRGGGAFLARHLAHHAAVATLLARSMQPLQPNCWHIAPDGYHLLVEDRATLALSVDAPVHYCRPAIDPLLMSAARVFGAQTIAVILTGANADGAAGCARVHAAGGSVLVQNPACAEVATMPAAALARCPEASVADDSAAMSLMIKRKIQT